MAKANLELPDGTKVTIEGAVDEVASLLKQVSSSGGTTKKGATRSPARRKAGSGAKTASKKSVGPTEYIRELIGEDFFKTKREISAVRVKLEEHAHIYPVTRISAPLFRLVKGRELRRIKEDGAWKYVNP